MPYKTRPVQVLIDVDIGIADFVEFLNTIPGVRTHSSCQGTIGEGDPYPYRAQVLVSWETPEALACLQNWCDVTFPEDCDGSWCYVHPQGSNI